MTTRKRKHTNFYTKGQQRAARILLTVWLLTNCSPDITLAASDRGKAIVPATTASPSGLALGSSPSTPQPEGILQLSPDSPGLLWGSRVAIDTVPEPMSQPPSSLRARTIDKLASHLARPNIQAAPRTQVGPVAEAIEESSSSGQHPAVDPSSRTATIESFRAYEIHHLPQLSSSIALAKLSHLVERPSLTQQLRAILDQEGVCVLHGFGGAGKSTFAAHYGHQRKEEHPVRWIPAEDSSKLQGGYEELAQVLQLSYQNLAPKLAAAPSKYRQELAKLVYDALANHNPSTLLILDNAKAASHLADFLLPRPSAVQAIITTRNTQAFEDQYTQISLAAFSQEEGQSYLPSPFQSHEASL